MNLSDVCALEANFWTGVMPGIINGMVYEECGNEGEFFVELVH
jgi:hypothetical protein